MAEDTRAANRLGALSAILDQGPRLEQRLGAVLVGRRNHHRSIVSTIICRGLRTLARATSEGVFRSESHDKKARDDLRSLLVAVLRNSAFGVGETGLGVAPVEVLHDVLCRRDPDADLVLLAERIVALTAHFSLRIVDCLLNEPEFAGDLRRTPCNLAETSRFLLRCARPHFAILGRGGSTEFWIWPRNDAKERVRALLGDMHLQWPGMVNADKRSSQLLAMRRAFHTDRDWPQHWTRPHEFGAPLWGDARV